MASRMLDTLILEIPAGKDFLTKPELFVLDFLSNYQWDRPLNMLSNGGDLNIGIKDYLMYDGFSYRFVPFKNKISSTDPGIVDANDLYRKMTDGTFKWDALSRKDWFVDYQNLYTFLGVLSQRQLFVNVANALIDAREDEKAEEILDLCQKNFPEENFPLETISLGFSSNDYMVVQMVENYYFLGEKAKARDLGLKLAEGLMESSRFYLEFFDYASSNFESCHRCILYLADVFKQYGDKELSDRLLDSLEVLVKAATNQLGVETDVAAQPDSAEVEE
jgi:hypothetical protein